MIKKRLGDLLREEAEQLKPEVEETASDLEESTEAADLSQQNSSDQILELPSNKQSIKPSHVELETTISELTKALQKAQRKENSLQQQVNNLELELEEEKKLIKKLKSEVSQEKKIKTELEEAKKVIVQLSEVNSQLAEKTNPRSEVNSRLAEKTNPPKPKQESSLQKQDYSLQNQIMKSAESYLSKIPYHSMQHDAPSPAISDTDLGWFD